MVNTTWAKALIILIRPSCSTYETYALQHDLVPFRQWVNLSHVSSYVHGPFEFANVNGHCTCDTFLLTTGQSYDHRPLALLEMKFLVSWTCPCIPYTLTVPSMSHFNPSPLCLLSALPDTIF